MTSRRFMYAAGAVALLLGALILAPGTRAQEVDGNYGIGIPDVFLPKYLAFRTRQVASDSPDVMRIKLGYVKGLSRSFIFMAGEAAIDLGSGAFTVNLAGLTPLQTYTVWLVNRIRGQDSGTGFGDRIRNSSCQLVPPRVAAAKRGSGTSLTSPREGSGNAHPTTRRDE